jgi:hypothetical protein
VKIRPVRFPPLAAGANPTMRILACGSPKAGSGRAQYVSPRNRRGGVFAESSRHATSRGQRRQETTSRSTRERLSRAFVRLSFARTFP